MKKLFSLFISLFILLISNYSSFSQEEKEKDGLVSMDISADLVSRYIWRGAQYGGSSPNIQPDIALNVGNMSLGSWSSYSLGGTNFVQEFDIYLSYTFLNEMFSVTVTDYFFPNDTVDYNYYDYKKNQTGHVFEGMLSFNGTEKVPLSAFVAVNFFGADAARLGDNPSNSDFNQWTGIQYSTYAEIDYSTTIKKVDFKAFLGMNFTKPKPADSLTGFIGEIGYYGDKIGVVNVGITASKGIPITDKYQLPISVSLITNPQSKKIFAVFAISF
jgi:hypothetical protein